MSSNDIKELAELLRRLRQEDKNLRVFGADSHQYKLGQTLAEAELQSFERKHQIKLPEDYRLFLKEIGNGGAGPFYGLEPLEKAAQYRDLSKPFPFTKATDSYSDEELEEWGDRDEYPGVLELCHQGCAIYSYLVVNGPAHGTIWNGREDFYPTELSFGRWYRRWVEKALRTLENEPLVDKLALGMSKEQILAAAGGDWQERKALRNSIYFFEAPEIPAQLELNEDRIVIKINLWSFILAQP
ncbi:SMI1/KNR4 family protein [Microcoleus sp. Pol14C6]|uniref:SMI1/KNR4 family protein n=1 Tax=unclassified Microcoleus TaxID=2642155 RepID=UPI002FD0BC9E